ncbi:MAG: AMP-binding protein [Acidobacteriia bacterium]|nr:AMP-binding protein [Terriglobia bacterium]
MATIDARQTAVQEENLAAPARWSTLGEMVAAQAAQFGNRTAILAPGREPLSFARLEEHVQSIRSLLWALGIGRGDIVASVLPNGPDAATAFLSVSSCAAFAPLNPSLRRNEFERVFADLNPRLILAAPAQAQAARKAALMARIPVIDVVAQSEAGVFTLPGTSGEKSSSVGRLAQSEDIAYILATSGTTGRPKLAPTSHRGVCSSLVHRRRLYDLTSDDRCLSMAAAFHTGGLVGSLATPLWSGGSVVCTPGFHVEGFFEWLDEYRPTWFSSVPTVFQELLARAPQHADVLERSSIRFFRSSAAAMPATVADRIEELFHAPLLQGYGLTEALGVTADSIRGPRKRGSSGRPFCDEVAVVDDRGRTLPPGQPGEIVVRGPTVFAGYIGNSEATRQAFRDGWFRTRDIGHFDEDGFLFVTGRASEVINRGGEKISPFEVDQVLLSHRAVAKAVTFPEPHDKLGEEVAAAVVLRDGASTTESELLEFAAARLAAHNLPRQIFFLDKLPTGPTGKVLRSKMHEHTASLARHGEQAPAPFVKPRSDHERRVAVIVARVLRLDRVGIHDNFFQLGGDSLAATEGALLLEEEFGLASLSPGIFHWAPTVAQLAGIMADPARLERSYDVIPLQTEGHGIPLFLIEPGDEGFRIAQHLGQEHPFYGIPIPASKDPSQARSIEQMAAECIDALRRFQPDGPYALTGWCAHGVIALEMARQLEEQGSEVSFVAMLDVRNAFLPALNAPHLAWVKSWRRLRKIAFAGRHWPAGLLGRLRNRVTAEPPGPVLETTLAQRGYRPRPWRGRMVHVWCTIAPRGRYFDPEFGWNHLALAGFVFHEVPGDHLTFIQEPSVAQVARILAGELDRAQPSQQPAARSDP